MASAVIPWLEPLRDIIAGTLGGIAGKLIEYPFDTLKVRLQTLQISPVQPAAAAAAAAPSAWSWQSFVGLYRGMSLPLLGTVLETATLFTANGYLKRKLREAGDLPPGAPLPMQYVIAAGGGTGFFVSWVLTPIELVKCRMQVAGQPDANGVPRRSYPGPLACLRSSIAEEGMRVLYRGHLGTILREMPGTACWFGAYEAFLRSMTPAGQKREDLHPVIVIAAGALGGMAYWLAMFPCDTVKSAMQTESSSSPGVGVGAVQAPAAPPAAPAGAPAAAASSAAAGAGPVGRVVSGAASVPGAAARPLGVASFSTLARPALQARGQGAAPAAGLVPGGLLRSFASLPRPPWATSPLLRSVAAAVGTVASGQAGATARLLSSGASAGAALAAPPPPHVPLTFSQTFAAIYRATGVRGLYAGITPTLVRAAPSNAVIFLVYEWSSGLLGEAMGIQDD